MSRLSQRSQRGTLATNNSFISNPRWLQVCPLFTLRPRRAWELGTYLKKHHAHYRFAYNAIIQSRRFYGFYSSVYQFIGLSA